jgi:hypothetical protein
VSMASRDRSLGSRATCTGRIESRRAVAGRRSATPS